MSWHHDPYPYPGVMNYPSGLAAVKVPSGLAAVKVPSGLAAVKVPSELVVVTMSLAEPWAWRHRVTVAASVGLVVHLTVKQFRPWHHQVDLSWFPQSTGLVVFTIIVCSLHKLSFLSTIKNPITICLLTPVCISGG
jgi:hypothetical protein